MSPFKIVCVCVNVCFRKHCRATSKQQYQIKKINPSNLTEKRKK